MTEQKKGLPEWVAIQHDGAGGVVCVTPGIRAEGPEEAKEVLRDMARRGGNPVGRVLLLRRDSLAEYGVTVPRF